MADNPGTVTRIALSIVATGSGHRTDGVLVGVMASELDALEATVNGSWWITTAPFLRGGEKVLGPFHTRELALDVRAYVEKVGAPETFWVEQES